MLDFVTTVLLWFNAIACALMGGLYFAFSTFIMTALGRIEPAAGIAAMNAINATILRSLFMPLFLGTTLASLALAIIALTMWSEATVPAVFAGSVIYILGMFVCTMVYNVPLNNELARSETSNGSASAVWQRFLTAWTRWNHVRTIASTLSSILFAYALVARDN